MGTAPRMHTDLDEHGHCLLNYIYVLQLFCDWLCLANRFEQQVGGASVLSTSALMTILGSPESLKKGGNWTSLGFKNPDVFSYYCLSL